MFVDDLKAAVVAKNQKRTCQLIMSIPVKNWRYPGSPSHAEASFEGVNIVMYPKSGRLDTCEAFMVSVLWPDKITEFLGEYATQELRIPR